LDCRCWSTAHPSDHPEQTGPGSECRGPSSFEIINERKKR
jgi:hypothetical protein